MKSLINKIKTVGLASLGLAMLWSCSEVLDETPRSIYDPGFFQTDKAVLHRSILTCATFTATVTI